MKVKTLLSLKVGSYIKYNSLNNKSILKIISKDNGRIIVRILSSSFDGEFAGQEYTLNPNFDMWIRDAKVISKIEAQVEVL